jgi:hypothetical protein
MAIAVGTSHGQKMIKEKYDKTCLDNAGKKFITCNASAGTSEKAKQACQKTMDDEKKLCKKS